MLRAQASFYGHSNNNNNNNNDNCGNNFSRWSLKGGCSSSQPGRWRAWRLNGLEITITITTNITITITIVGDVGILTIELIYHHHHHYLHNNQEGQLKIATALDSGSALERYVRDQANAMFDNVKKLH